MSKRTLREVLEEKDNPISCLVYVKKLINTTWLRALISIFRIIAHCGKERLLSGKEGIAIPVERIAIREIRCGAQIQGGTGLCLFFFL